MLVRREELVASIERSSPGLSPEWMDWVMVFVMAYSIALHLLDVILLVWLTPKVLRGRRWARIILSVYLVVATAGSLYSARSEEHTSELQSRFDLLCRLLLETKNL